MPKTTKANLVRQNLQLVKRLYPALAQKELRRLRELTKSHHLSVSQGEILSIDGKWYVTHAGLLRIAAHHRCVGIRTALQERQSEPSLGRWVFRATVYKSPGSKGFIGHGDADPTNVSPLVRGAEMRVAESRAIDRALRAAYGVPICSLEELGPLSSPANPSRSALQSNRFHSVNGSNNGEPRLRDRLCRLIRQHQLDSTLVKHYAAAFCGTQELREASRDLVESFITHLAEWAARDRSGLLCKLNSFAPSQEVHS